MAVSKPKIISKPRSNNAVFNFVGSIFRLLYESLVAFLANLVADVMDHSRVQQASTETLVRGITQTMEDPNLPHRAASIYVQIREDTNVSRQLGEQFPKLAANFIAGAASSLKRSASFSNVTRRQSSVSSATNNTRNLFGEERQHPSPPPRQQRQQQGLLHDATWPSPNPTIDKYAKAVSDPDTSREEEVIQQLSLAWRNNKAFNRADSITSIASLDSMS